MTRQKETEKNYDDIINLPHHVSKTHPQMSRENRAAQFAPFMALTGYKEAVDEAERLTDDFSDMDESGKEVLDRKLSFLMERVHEHPEVSITCFRPDSRKEGGAYLTLTGFIKKIDSYEQKIFLEDGKSIPLAFIVEIGGECFEEHFGF